MASGFLGIICGVPVMPTSAAKLFETGAAQRNRARDFPDGKETDEELQPKIESSAQVVPGDPFKHPICWQPGHRRPLGYLEPGQPGGRGTRQWVASRRWR